MQLRKIHLACGDNIFKDWENYDFFPKSGAKYIDLLKPFFFDDNSIDYIYFEHAIEHFDEVDGLNILKEFYRVLKINGTVRLITPSLDSYLYRYKNWDSFENEEHKKMFINETQFLNYAFFGESINLDIKFLNNLKSSQIGHKFIYSEKDIINKLNFIGFKQLKICDYKISDNIILNNLETRPNYKDIILEFKK